MLENIRLSFKGIWSHKMRSFLTMLGIIIGIAAIIAIVSTIKGTNEQIKENLIGSGDNTVEIALYQGDWTYEMGYEGAPQGVPVIREEALKRIKEVEHVEDASVFLSRQDYGGVYYLNTTLTGGFVLGVDQNYFNTCNYLIQRGRGFTESDYKEYRKVALLDEDSANGLFQGEDPLGKTIEIKKEPYIVIGIVTKTQKFEPVINSIEDYYTYSQDSSGKVYVPDSTWPIIYQFDEPQNLVIKVDSTDYMTNAGKESAAILNEYLTTSDETMKYKAEDLLEQAKKIQELGDSTNNMLIWIAGISLIVGGIGVMNIMLVSVTERTQEIGLKKAIGARKTNILGQFLTEASVLTSLGGLLGVASGIVLAEVISRVSEMPVSISVPAAVGAVVFSMIIGIVFGMLPSYKAANLDPIEALRRE
ncbi:MAG: ABC transporter permease [Eubacterium sp.]|jgi:putative ABC transport system permease protein|nr:ABC transporter permease [Eubacterium sp.]